MTPHLSPITRAGLLALIRGDIPNKAPGRGKAERELVPMWRCLHCQDLHEQEVDAEECCALPDADEGTTNCPVCGSVAAGHRDAADCCLWKDLPPAQRHPIADAVQAGATTWAEALGVAP